ncbi:MAG TPA: xanthine dehydrogenase family protein molybdopterin-binding subunit [Candidatus Dormibacteraeota bacterium]
MPPYVGRAMPRREDERLITGRGRYAGDIHIANLLHVAILRSPFAHARIASIDTAAARQMPGVVAVVTAQDLTQSARSVSNWVSPDQAQLARPVLAEQEVRYVGEAVAAVVAESEYQAQDGVAALEVDFEPLPAVADVMQAREAGAPLVHSSEQSNVGREQRYTFGDVEAAFAGAPRVVKESFALARIAAAAMETRVATAQWEPAESVLTIWSSTQGVFSVRQAVADALEIDPEQVVALAHDVGGGFGPKGTVYGEEVLVAWLARHLGRPVTWWASRSEDTATTVQAHGTRLEIELAAGADGRLRGLRGRVIHDLGAYPGPGNGQPNNIVPHMVSAYVLPALDVVAELVFTNTVPTGFIRGGGRPIGNYAIERMMDRLAREVGVDPAEVRRRNFIQPQQMPYDTHFPRGRSSTIVYDSGDYPRLLETALTELGYEELRRRQGDRPGGKLLGVGIASCVEEAGFGRGEPARIRVADGEVRAWVGSTPQGQGHETMAAMIVADRLGYPIEKVAVEVADTRRTAFATFTAGSRSAIHVGNAVAQTATAVRNRILEEAAETLEANPADLELADGVVSVRGVPSRSVQVADIFPDGLEIEEQWKAPNPSAYSSGCHAVALTVDPETGAVDLQRYVIAYDTGKVINALTRDGQLLGGLVHGLGIALFEEAIYQPDGGFQSASFLDYTIPSAPEISASIRLVPRDTATDVNPEGIKGVGESGTIPSLAAVSNAIEDALRGVRPNARLNELPVTPLRLHRLLAG